jgi:hypothetical protein
LDAGARVDLHVSSLLPSYVLPAATKPGFIAAA